MTEFITGTSGSGKGGYIVSRIKERLGSGRKMYLIVPEQQALLWEARICRALPPSAALELEVLSFRRLADTVFRTYGGQNTVFSGKADRLINMWRAVTSVKSSLKHYAGADGHEEKYVPLLLETLSDLKARGVSVESLAEAERELEGEGYETLRDKLSDLSLICSAYNAITEEGGSEDPDNILDMLAKSLRLHSFFRDCDVFIDSFYSLTPIENEILYYVMRDCSDLFITFTMDPSSDGIHFDHVRRFYDGASTSAAACHREVTKVDLGKNKRCQSDEISYLGDFLWDFSAKKTDCAPRGDVKIIRCADRYEEAAAVGAVIERAVHEGASYSDVAVIARDIEKYRGILDVRLDSLGIPYHLSKRSSIATSPVLTLVSSLLSAVADNFRRETVVRCIKTGLCPVTRREAANFEEYSATWNIRGKRAYLRADDWTMNPAGYRRELSDWGRTVIEDSNRVRAALRGAVSSLTSLFGKGTAPLGEVCRTVYEILTSFGVYEKLISDADELESLGKKEEAEVCEKSYSALIDALNALASAAPDVEVGAGAASRLFLTVASSFDVGTIPSGIDMVTLGSASGVRCENVTHAILIGCAEGEFPASPSDGGFFNETDKVTLETLGIVLSDGAEAETGEELFRFWRCVTLPSEKLTVTYPAATEEGAAGPSVGARQIMKLLGVAATDFSSLSPEDVIWSVAGASDLSLTWRYRAAVGAVASLAEKYPALKDAERLTGELSADGDRITALRRGGRLALTQARIDSFSGCPFAYTMKYVMKLGESERAAVGAADVGNLVHRVLELFFSETAGREFPLSDGETEEIVDRITKEYIAEIMRGAEATSRQKYLFMRLRRNVLILIRALMEEFSETDFRPYRFELSMGGDEGCPVPLEFTSHDGTKISLFGTIDRVDTFEKDGSVYVRVVDYKTFGKTFKLSDIQKGINLQLLIYLFTLWKSTGGSFRKNLAPNGETVLPAGMIYLSAAPDSATSDTPVGAEEARDLAMATVGRSGVLLDDETSLAAMGSALGGKYIPVRRTHILTIEEFGKLYDEIEQIIIGIGDEIKSGVCASRPRKLTSYHPCDFCKMKPVCRHTEERSAQDE